MRANLKVLGGVAIFVSSAAMNPARVEAANAYPLFTDPNADGLAFGGTDVFESGAYALDDGAQLNGNDIVLYVQNFSGPCCHGAGFSVPVSNGENGIDQSFDGAMNQDLNPDVPNTEPVNSVFATIGNPTGKLQNGNVIRFSAWYRKDPANPIAVDPQIQPVLKFEFWKEALSTNQDTEGGQLQPLYGDKVFDQDQHGGAIGIPVADKAQRIDFNGDGVVIDGAAAGEGRVSQISTGAWTLVESLYTVNDGDWLGIGDDIYTVEDIEEIRAVMFFGDFAGTNLTGDGDGGNMLADNILVEVFRNAGAVTANTNPNPTLSEGLPGDYNGDGTVDAADFTVWRDHLGHTIALTNENPAAATPGFVDQEDYDFWKSQFGMGSGAGGSVDAPLRVPASAEPLSVAVPEPSALVLALLVSMCVSWAAQRRPSSVHERIQGHC